MSAEIPQSHLNVLYLLGAILAALSSPLCAAAQTEVAHTRISVGEQPLLPEDGCVYAGLGYSDRVFVNMPVGIYQCRAQHWYSSQDATGGAGLVPDDFESVSAQAALPGDGCIYAGLGFSDGSVIQTGAGNFVCKSHHWDRH